MPSALNGFLIWLLCLWFGATENWLSIWGILCDLLFTEKSFFCIVFYIVCVNPGKYRPVSLISVSSEITKIMLGNIDNKGVIGNSQLSISLNKSKLCLTNLAEGNSALFQLLTRSLFWFSSLFFLLNAYYKTGNATSDFSSSFPSSGYSPFLIFFYLI